MAPSYIYRPNITDHPKYRRMDEQNVLNWEVRLLVRSFILYIYFVHLFYFPLIHWELFHSEAPIELKCCKLSFLFKINKKKYLYNISSKTILFRMNFNYNVKNIIINFVINLLSISSTLSDDDKNRKKNLEQKI